MFPSSRPTASKLPFRLGSALGLVAFLLSISAAPALARGAAKAPAEKETATAVSARCEGQTFSQPFAALGDSNYYTLAPGGEFNSSSEGWELSGGAQIVKTARPDGTSGGALNMPSGSKAVSPSICVTLQYPTARVWVRNVEGDGSVDVAVAYAGTKTETNAKDVGHVQGQQTTWTLSNPFNVQPQIAGKTEETRQVRFVFTAGGKRSDFQIYGLYIDPRMR